jgi:hypothetical protein
MLSDDPVSVTNISKCNNSLPIGDSMSLTHIVCYLLKFASNIL